MQTSDAISTQDQSQSTKEINFRALEQKYQRQLEQERQARLEAEKIAQEAINRNRQIQTDEDDDTSEPYVDHKRLNKTLNRFGEKTQTDIQKSMEMAKQAAKEELKQEMWLENNPDFDDVIQHADKLIESNPQLAKALLRMPQGFERQRLVYENIKALNLHKEKPKEPSVQDKIDANRRSPYYQPSGISNAPYATNNDFSPTGQKSAYDRMKELQQRLNINR